jgi:hypothetical protein
MGKNRATETDRKVSDRQRQERIETKTARNLGNSCMSKHIIRAGGLFNPRGLELSQLNPNGYISEISRDEKNNKGEYKRQQGMAEVK